ncbi:MAG TPA: hypothetical protein PLZ27_02055 [Bacillota bacterium]|nr:hypothetical protein [Bacillota bacterium]
MLVPRYVTYRGMVMSVATVCKYPHRVYMPAPVVCRTFSEDIEEREGR